MGSGKDPIANLVAAVADGTPVDWDRIEHDATPAQRGFIEQLRLIATLFDSHKSLATPESDHPKSARTWRVTRGALGMVAFRRRQTLVTVEQRGNEAELFDEAALRR